MWSLQNLQMCFFFIMHCWVTILFIVATLTGSLIRSIGLSDKMSIPRCKLEFWIFMVLSALRIIGKPVSVILGRKLVSVTCHWKYFYSLLFYLQYFSSLWRVQVHSVFYIMEHSKASIGRLFLCVLVTSLVFFMYCKLVLSLVGKSLMLSLFISIIYDQYITSIRIPLLFLLLDFGLSTAAVCSHWLFFLSL